jgi:hypothetical protein
MASSLADRFQTKLAALGGTGASIADKERSFYSSVSGLPATRSLADHKQAYYRAQASLTSGSLVDNEEAFWIFTSAGNNKGSWNDRAYIYYGS